MSTAFSAFRRDSVESGFLRVARRFPTERLRGFATPPVMEVWPPERPATAGHYLLKLRQQHRRDRRRGMPVLAVTES